MDVSIRGRGVGVTDRFENYVGSKTEKVEHLLPKAQAFEVKVSRLSDRSPSNGDRVEITLIGPGPVIRAESTGNDKYTAFDIAYGRVLERIRRLKDRRHDRRFHIEAAVAAFEGRGGFHLRHVPDQNRRAVAHGDD